MCIALMFSFPALLFLLLSMGIYLHEPGVPARGLNCALASLPLAVTVAAVFWYFARETSAGRALLCTIVAEVVGLSLGALLLAACVHLKQEPRVLLEQRAPFTWTPNPAEVPELPLSSEAVGVALPDGKFHPIMFLKGQLPGHAYKTPLLSVDVKSGPPRLKVYRGTNELAAANHFLGEFQISGYAKTKQSLQLMVIFDLEPDRQLLLQVRDVDAAHNLALKLKQVKASR